ncbi:MAG: cytochrome-c peroxidase [Rhodospirillales bacterium 69-11]|nr:c-type cytochrome [Rhodospirillales bacterium]MBN8925796.1 c-type cytochrome [Rhodospirillales bacterium]OJW24064.1 MAG: cytochrome-c peroxidase [Rhodospirillales bacterium 69-11]
MTPFRLLRAVLPLLLAVPAAAQSPALPWPDPPPIAASRARVAAITTLGRDLFFDPALSASGRVACATCHDPRFGFSPANAEAVQPGGATLEQVGTRAVPSLSYAQFSPSFSEHYYESDEDGDGSVDAGPTGGFTWDGRASRARDQARIPLLAPNEMANASPAAVVTRLASGPHAAALRTLYGQDLFADPDRAFDAVLDALEVFQQDQATFAPFTSKYDAWLRGSAQLTAAEDRGRRLFEDPGKGNCAQCHISRPSGSGALPLFTDYGLVALGVPRNVAIPANRDPGYFDLGLCGPERRDLTDHPDYCGLFKTPSLRNVALRRSFFHNGVMHSLRDAVAFYVERDVAPQRWYPTDAHGVVRKFDDLPERFWENVNDEPPFGGEAGDAPRLSPAEIDDVVAFLQTLTDGYTPR